MPVGNAGVVGLNGSLARYNAAQADFSGQLSPTWTIGGGVLMNTYEGLGRKSFLQTRLTIEKRFLQKMRLVTTGFRLPFLGMLTPMEIGIPGRWRWRELSPR